VVKRTSLNRRRFVQGTAAAMGGLAAVRIAPHAHATAQEQVQIVWWDQFLPLEELHRSI
jgi:hypothetical protein